VRLEIRFASKVDTDRSSEPWDAWTLGNDPSKDGILERCFPGPGEYRVVLSVDRYTEFIAVKGGGREGEVSAWRGKVASNEVRIKVTERTLKNQITGVMEYWSAEQWNIGVLE